MVLLPLSIGSSVMGVRFEAEGAGLTVPPTSFSAG